MEYFVPANGGIDFLNRGSRPKSVKQFGEKSLDTVMNIEVVVILDHVHFI